MSAPTRSLLAYKKANNDFRAALDAYHDVAFSEFPSGSKVTWTHTYGRDGVPIKRIGTVVEVNNGRAKIQMKPGGPNHYIDCWALEHVNP